MSCERYFNIKESIKFSHDLTGFSEDDKFVHYEDCNDCSEAYEVIRHAVMFCRSCCEELTALIKKDPEVQEEMSKFREYFGVVFEADSMLQNCWDAAKAKGLVDFKK